MILSNQSIVCTVDDQEDLKKKKMSRDDHRGTAPRQQVRLHERG